MKERIMNLSRQRENRNKLRQHTTPAEATLWKLLKGKSVKELKFRRQHGVGTYILDFYCPSLKLCIELDGESHTLKQEDDDKRTAFLKETAGIQVIRFENRVVFENPDAILTKIEEIWQKHQSTLLTGAHPC